MRQHINLGVTGLRRSGKTVFLTALIYQLTERGSDGLRAFEHRGIKLWPAKIVEQGDDLPPFPYEEFLASLRRQQPQWPSPTDQEYACTLEMVYDGVPYSNRVQKLWRRCWGEARDHGTIRLALHDYPGEYLLDTPLPRADYRRWSKETLDRMASQCLDARREYHGAVAEWLKRCFEEAASPAGEGFEVPAELQQAYGRFLRAARQRGMEMLQPGMALCGWYDRDDVPCPGPVRAAAGGRSSGPPAVHRDERCVREVLPGNRGPLAEATCPEHAPVGPGRRVAGAPQWRGVLQRHEEGDGRDY